jgi:hypothetical protein
MNVSLGVYLLDDYVKCQISSDEIAIVYAESLRRFWKNGFANL